MAKTDYSLEVENLFTNYSSYLDGISDSSVWSGAAKDSLFPLLEEVGNTSNTCISNQINAFNEAIRKYEIYTSNKTKLNEMEAEYEEELALLTDNQDILETLAVDIKTLRIENQRLKKEIDELLAKVIEIDVESSLTASSSGTSTTISPESGGDKDTSTSEQATSTLGLIMPMEGSSLNSDYGMRADPYTGKQTFHYGIDFGGAYGASVKSVDDGVVVVVGDNTQIGYRGYGDHIMIEHTKPNGEKYYSFYAHLRSDSIPYEVGQTISQGDVIGIQGSTGRSTGDHLHFEIREAKEGQSLVVAPKVDPAPYLEGLL